LLNSIISHQLSTSSCNKLLSGDGITTSDLTIKGVHGLFGPVSIDARSARKSVPAIGDVASAAKNLDEYQFLICSLVPSLPDKDGTTEISCGYHSSICKACPYVAVEKYPARRLGAMEQTCQSTSRGNIRHIP
jgi:hypothetical protein